MRTMEVVGPPPVPECTLLEEESGMKFYGLKKTLLFNYEPKIKIITIGNENDLDTRNIILLGATGAGKTCLVSALVNHILGVKFEDNYRYVLKDEAGDCQKSSAESQTEYVVGYLIYARPGSDRMYNYLIVDTPGFKDSRGEERAQEVSEQITTFLQDVDGVDELHCIGFVVNGTIARIQDQFSDIAEEFCNVFGENAKEITKILISFGHMKRPPVHDVLKCSCLKDYKTCKFDNVSLTACNQPNDDISEEEIAVSKSFWNATARVYNSFFNEIDSVNSVSLLLTRETLNEIKYLHESIDNLKEATESYLDLMLDLKQLEDKCREHQTIMTDNADYEETVDVKVRDGVVNVPLLMKLNIHAHNCQNCVMSCRYPCFQTLSNVMVIKNWKLINKACPQPGLMCDWCSCPNNDHVKSSEYIVRHRIEKRQVYNDDKKALFDEAKSKHSLVIEEIADLFVHISEQRSKIDKNAQNITEHSNKIKANSLRSEQHSPSEFIEKTLEQIRMEKLSRISKSQERPQGVDLILEDLQLHLEGIILSPSQ